MSDGVRHWGGPPPSPIRLRMIAGPHPVRAAERGDETSVTYASAPAVLSDRLFTSVTAGFTRRGQACR